MDRRTLTVLYALAGVALGGSGCAITPAPRSAVFGQTALTGVGRGSADIGVATGVSYTRLTSPPVQQGNTERTTSTDVVGLFTPEGNLAIGLAEILALNFHFSQIGVQPGVKIVVLRTPSVSLAVLPELGLGYYYLDSSQETVQGGTTQSQDLGGAHYFGLLVGAKFIMSLSNGFYGGFAYDFQYLRQAETAPTDEDVDSSDQHVLALAVGWELSVGIFHLRPELSFCLAPAINFSHENGATNVTTTYSGGWSFTFFPNLTVAIGSRSAPRPAAAPTRAPAPAPAPGPIEAPPMPAD